MSISITLDRGGEAHFSQFDGEKVEVLSTLSSPPGSTLCGKTIAGEEALEIALQIKVRGCSKQADERYLISGRLVSLSRVQRDALKSSLADLS